MIGRQRSPEQTMNKNGISPEQTMNKNGIQSNGLGYASIEVRPRVWNLNSTAKLLLGCQLQWTLVIVNNLSLVNISGETGRLFYNINYMLNSKHLSLVNKIGDKTEFTITRVHCIVKKN